MNYYIQGDPDRADKIKAAFEKLGIDVLDFGFADKTLVYCSIGGCGGCVQYLPYSINLMHILHSHPDYKELELELPAQPNFKVHDWVVDGDRVAIIYDLQKNCYVGHDVNRRDFVCRYSDESRLHLWTIADAKDGDVLATDNGWTCIFKAFDGCVFSSYCFMDSEKWFYELGSEVHTPDSRINGNIHPATKEQRDLLFTKMKEAGYEWDADKKELKKIQPHYDISNFKAGMPVLVRWYSTGRWRYSLYSFYEEDSINPFDTVKGSFTQCIPYNEDTKHLLGTTDPCDERYVNW